MRKRIIPLVVAVMLALGGCATIPPERPELSAQLGTPLVHWKQHIFDFFRNSFSRKATS